MFYPFSMTLKKTFYLSRAAYIIFFNYLCISPNFLCLQNGTQYRYNAYARQGVHIEVHVELQNDFKHIITGLLTSWNKTECINQHSLFEYLKASDTRANVTQYHFTPQCKSCTNMAPVSISSFSHSCSSCSRPETMSEWRTGLRQWQARLAEDCTPFSLKWNISLHSRKHWCFHRTKETLPRIFTPTSSPLPSSTI